MMVFILYNILLVRCTTYAPVTVIYNYYGSAPVASKCQRGKRRHAAVPFSVLV